MTSIEDSERLVRTRPVSTTAFRSWAAALVLWVATSPLLAHHSLMAKFDPDETRTLEGEVTLLHWENPHVHILMDVRDGATVASWAVELESRLNLERSGWDANTLKPGDIVKVEGMIASDGSRQIWGDSVAVESTGRRVLFMSASARAALVPTPGLPVRPTPRWPDGQPRLGPPPGEAGYWARPSSTVLMETGASVEMDRDGLLLDLDGIDGVAPFQPWAQYLYESRQRTFLRSDPTFLSCKPPGAVRQFQMPYGNQFLEDRASGRIFLTAGGGNHDWHFIYSDDRPFRGHGAGDDGNLLYYGQARYRWEDDTLIVESEDFNEKFWLTNGGLPHTEQLHLTERFTRTDFYHMEYAVTIDDPGAYTRPWSAGWTLEWVAGEDLPTYYCQENRP
jgi:Family of unknown function (DUF6152)